MRRRWLPKGCLLKTSCAVLGNERGTRLKSMA